MEPRNVMSLIVTLLYPAALPVETPAGDPCTDYKSVGGTHFTVEKPSGDAPCFGLFDSPSAWIRFHLKEEDDIAEIPTVPIKVKSDWKKCFSHSCASLEV